ncbi:sodium-coupled monocarboxylate transporter 1-like [Diadema setosum]|uniref:sodium-coupled monocarboxylate transporter 1-like n=1 Tax=Diadema setosum TaxID=31175 RepID=UPI003B3B9E96
MATLSVFDYVVFALVLVLSAVIGLYHALTGGKQSTTEEFFVADRKMNPVPVGFSLLASWISAIAILGNPAETYSFGTMYCYSVLIFPITMLITTHIYVPLFYNLKLSSIYAYLEMRFNWTVRVIGLTLFLVYMVMYMSVVLYTPSLATSAVTGMDWWLIVLLIGTLCTLYTALGGIKAVIWTDVFQSVVMIGCLLVVAIYGVVKKAGFSTIWAINKEGGRIVFDDIRVDPTVRHTVWSLLIGGNITWLSVFAVNQVSIQRYLSCSSLKRAKSTSLVGIPLYMLFSSLSLFCGLVIYAFYADCDPLQAGYVTSSDQLLSYYVLNELGFIPGLSGLFGGAILSGTLSSVSSGLNSVAAVTVKDIVKVIVKDMTDKRETVISKIIATSYGVLCVALALAASQMGPVLQLAITLMGLIGGPLLGVFTLGIFFPWANSKGAIVGLLCGIGMALWIGVGSFLHPPDKPQLPVTTDGCLATENMTTPSALPTTNDPYEFMTTSHGNTSSKSGHSITDLYHVSYLYYGLVSGFIVVFVGLLFSFLTGATDPKDVDPRLLSRVSRTLCCCAPSGCRRKLDCDVLYEEKAKSDAQTDTLDVTKGSNLNGDVRWFSSSRCHGVVKTSRQQDEDLGNAGTNFVKRGLDNSRRNTW